MLGTAGCTGCFLACNKSRIEADYSRQGDIADFNILVGPLVEELDGTNFFGDFFGEDLVARWALDLDFAIVRHVGRYADTVVIRKELNGSRCRGERFRDSRFADVGAQYPRAEFT